MDRATTPIWRRRGIAATATAIAALLLASFVASFAAPQARADELASKRAEALRITGEVDRLNIRLADLDEKARYDASSLATANARYAAVSSQLAITRASLSDGRAQLLNRLVAVYEDGSVNQSILQVVSSGSFSNFLSRVQDVRNVSSEDAQIVGQLRVLRSRIAGERAQLKVAQSKAEHLSEIATRSRDAAAAQTAKRQALLDSVNRSVRALVRQQEQAELARQQAEALVQKQQQQSRDAAANFAPSDQGAAQTIESSVLGSPDTSQSSDADAGSGSGVGAEAASVAERYLGVPYVWGGATPSGFDCSGLVMYAFGQVGVSLPHLTYAQYGMGTHVSFGDLQRGDIVFFDGEAHEGLYLGNGEFIHAPHTGTVVQIASLSGYWASAFAGAVRI